jgi:hypothetical protein
MGDIINTFLLTHWLIKNKQTCERGKWYNLSTIVKKKYVLVTILTNETADELHVLFVEDEPFSRARWRYLIIQKTFKHNSGEELMFMVYDLQTGNTVILYKEQIFHV